MKLFEWNGNKNFLLQKIRGVGFEDVLIALSLGNLLDIIEHHNKEKYPNQRILIVKIKDYCYLVPFVEDKRRVFLKTIIPSRKATKKYLHQ